MQLLGSLFGVFSFSPVTLKIKSNVLQSFVKDVDAKETEAAMLRVYSTVRRAGGTVVANW